MAKKKVQNKVQKQVQEQDNQDAAAAAIVAIAAAGVGVLLWHRSRQIQPVAPLPQSRQIAAATPPIRHFNERAPEYSYTARSPFGYAF